MRILVIKNKDLILFQKERLIEACDDNPESSLRKLFIYSYSIKTEEYIYYLDCQVNEKKYKYKQGVSIIIYIIIYISNNTLG